MFFECGIRRLLEAELKRLEEETAQRIEEAIRKNVEERLSSDEVQLEVERRIEEGRKKLLEDVEAQLQKEKEAALNEARQKEVSNFTSGHDLISFHRCCCTINTKWSLKCCVCCNTCLISVEVSIYSGNIRYYLCFWCFLSKEEGEGEHRQKF